MLGQDVLGFRGPVRGDEKGRDPIPSMVIPRTLPMASALTRAGMPKDSSMFLRISASVTPLDLWTVTQFMPSS